MWWNFADYLETPRAEVSSVYGFSYTFQDLRDFSQLVWSLEHQNCKWNQLDLLMVITSENRVSFRLQMSCHTLKKKKTKQQNLEKQKLLLWQNHIHLQRSFQEKDSKVIKHGSNIWDVGWHPKFLLHTQRRNHFIPSLYLKNGDFFSLHLRKWSPISSSPCPLYSSKNWRKGTEEAETGKNLSWEGDRRVGGRTRQVWLVYSLAY